MNFRRLILVATAAGMLGACGADVDTATRQSSAKDSEDQSESQSQATESGSTCGSAAALPCQYETKRACEADQACQWEEFQPDDVKLPEDAPTPPMSNCLPKPPCPYDSEKDCTADDKCLWKTLEAPAVKGLDGKEPPAQTITTCVSKADEKQMRKMEEFLKNQPCQYDKEDACKADDKCEWHVLELPAPPDGSKPPKLADEATCMPKPRCVHDSKTDCEAENDCEWKKVKVPDGDPEELQPGKSGSITFKEVEMCVAPDLFADLDKC